MNRIQERVEICYHSISDRIPFKPLVALVLGSGLGGYAESGVIDVVSTIDYKSILDFPVSTAPSHAGRFVFGYVGKVPIVCMQGRVHFYEGYSMSDVVLPHRLMRMMGAEYLILTNAAGGVNKEFKSGSLMLITDHITSFVDSPLIGPNIDEFGPRFPDMSHVYDQKLQDLVRNCAANHNIELEEGVYLQNKGPNYETPAEVKLASILGADAVGMSTAVEAQAANHMGMKVIGISCISNMAAGISGKPLDEQEVIDMAKMVERKFTELVEAVIKDIGVIEGNV